MDIRPYKFEEAQKLYNIFFSSIRENAQLYYSDEQLKAWAPDEYDEEKWIQRMAKIQPYVIEDKGEILGYADLQENGYIDHFFIKGGQSGKGIGKKLMLFLLDQAESQDIKRLYADVSLAAQAFFKTFGFVVVKSKKVYIRGLEIDNALMEKMI